MSQNSSIRKIKIGRLIKGGKISGQWLHFPPLKIKQSQGLTQRVELDLMGIENHFFYHNVSWFDLPGINEHHINHDNPHDPYGYLECHNFTTNKSTRTL